MPLENCRTGSRLTPTILESPHRNAIARFKSPRVIGPLNQHSVVRDCTNTSGGR
jgi:hypothetical protein